jgi:hypothetical protein
MAVRDHHREALETVRQERERLRDTAETARPASEEARAAAECEGLFREIKDVNKLDSN